LRLLLMTIFSLCSFTTLVVTLFFQFSILFFFFLMLPPPPRSTLFPYTTLFRSVVVNQLAAQHARAQETGFAVKGQKDDIKALVEDRKSTRLNSSHGSISYAVFCLKKKKNNKKHKQITQIMK